MKKIFLFICVLLSVWLVSCDNYKNYELDGMWQLKTVKHADGSVSQVDSVYYSFQRELIFSYTLVNAPELAFYIYGYLDFPSENKVHIYIDKQFDGDNNFVDFLSHSGWSSADIVFDIKKYDKNNLVLSENGNTYTLKKF